MELFSALRNPPSSLSSVGISTTRTLYPGRLSSVKSSHFDVRVVWGGGGGVICLWGVNWCKSVGVTDKLPPNSYIVLPPLADHKRCTSGGLICLLPPHSYTILLPLEAQCSPKRRKSFELHFPKKSSHCSPTLTSFWAEKFNPGSKTIWRQTGKSLPKVNFYFKKRSTRCKMKNELTVGCADSKTLSL